MEKRIIFLGTPLFAVPILESLHKNGYPINTVYTQPPQKSNRGLRINKSPIHSTAEKLNIKIRTPKNLKSNKEEFNFFKNLNADLAVVVAYGKIIPKEYLNLTKKGFINVHGSILPRWRGAAPIQRSIMNLDKQTGISIMKLEEKLDSGPVSNIYKIKLGKNENAEVISNKLSLLASDKILDNVSDIFNNKVKFIAQDHSKATYAKKIAKSDGKIDWNDDATKILGKINGLFSTPGAFFNFNSERYKILKAEISKGVGKIGEVINEKLEIVCGNKQSIKILIIQRQGKKPQKIEEFMLGSQIKKGTILSSA